MSKPPPFARFLLLILAALFCPVPAHADAAPAPARAVEGLAVTARGEPLARATLYLFGLPPGETNMITLGDRSTVVTDDRGRFVWQVPAALPPLSDYVGVRPIPCYALAADRGAGRLQIIVRPDWRGASAEGAARDLLERTARPCVTKWVMGGPRSVLSVVAPDTGAVALTVRGPDGLALRRREVQVVSAGLWTGHEGAAVYTARTDDAGVIHMRWYSGPLRLRVFAPGLGFGSTGTFEALPGRAAAPPLPPLAPFARLSGTAAAALVGPGASVHVEDFFNDDTWYAPRGSVDAGGKWTLGGVLPGTHRLVLADGRGAGDGGMVTVAPGEHLGGLIVGPSASPAPAATPPPGPPDARPTARGLVTDSSGRGVAGADVYAVCLPSGGGAYGGPTVLVTTSDAAGAYVLPGLTGGGQPRQVSARLVAHRAGSPLAFAEWRGGKDPASGAWSDAPVDIALPDLHTGLTVRVLQGGRPLPNVPVELTAGGRSPLPPLAYHGQDTRAALALQKLLDFSARTGPDGAAHFADLAPGLWGVVADRPGEPWPLTPVPTAPFDVSAGVIVRAGEDLTYTVRVRPPPGEAVFRVLAPDGLPPVGSPVSLSALNTLYQGYGSSPSVPDRAGDERLTFPAPALVRMTASFRDASLPAFDPAHPLGPYFEGAALVAVSLAAPVTRPVALPARRYGPSGLRVRLEDAQGRPARGTVTAGDYLQPARYAASADAHGLVVFADMPAGDYWLVARLAGLPERTTPGGEGTPFPTDAVLRAATRQPLPQVARVQAGGETDVTFRPQPAGYLRLRLAVPKGRANDYSFDGRLHPYDDALDTRLDPATGEFVVGPLPAGRRTFRLLHFFPGPPWQSVPAGEAAVTVEAGRVTRAALVPRDPPGPPLLLESLAPTGTVLLADGKTPAWGARAGIFTADRQFPLRMVQADARGRLTVPDQWQGALWPWKLTPGNPPGAVVVAWLPGAAGAAIVPYLQGQDAHLVLPPPAALRGRVTVGGLAVGGLPSGFRIKAAYQGRGALNEALSVEATAQADGSFELAGLTPGTYRVQAVRDEIWLSEARTVTVGAAPLPALTLDIAPPGAAVILHLADGEGRPLAGRAVTIARPIGPLTAPVWPDGLTTDGTGDLRADGLEAGPHRLTVSGAGGGSVGFNVPVWTPDAPPSVRRVVVKSGRTGSGIGTDPA